ncbi:hypothetical protein PFISCL1PPCAC_11309, partial [Pristionchus fissidentatus]
LTLEILPTEHLYYILSHLDFQDRKTVRECSQALKEAVQQSTLNVHEISLKFDEARENELSMTIFRSTCYDSFTTSVIRNHSELIRRWLSELSERLFFRRLKADHLCIECHAERVSESIVKNVTDQFDFRSLHLTFNSLNQ